MKKIILIILLVIVLLFIFTWFLWVNKLNYWKHIQIKQNLIEHPENLPNKETAKYSSFWFKNLKADIYWLQTIQYIGGNAIWSEYKKYLYKILDLITELNPFFEKPYIIWNLLLPSYNHRYENLSEEEQKRNIYEAEKIWLKWVEKFCDLEKVKLIWEENNLNKIWTEDRYKNPCKSYTLPYYLAFVYYFYKKDLENSSYYYKVASANDDSLEWAKILTAIMKWKSGNREKAYFMFLNIAKYIETEDKICSGFASELEKLWAWIFSWNISLDWKLVKLVEKNREKIIGKFEKDEKSVISDTKCSNYLNKAVRELNLYYIEKANTNFEKDHDWNPAINAKALFDDGYIDFLPTDFQQYEDYGIIYNYDYELGNFDYKMGNY